ncbi:hypothetical protein DCS_00830 [Drechmeria coniospora]|uniref:Uncharacterized protein n=1 Tax=Drechmeria coniospora TaxID=98403 RepID=A0A151GRG9_DRECN|nr:hypothetical protein DCS_00830 [Drechmeria coniospora]KYK59696.1 hypothetical protein DCS_00830 [Drechmeria coniospora]
MSCGPLIRLTHKMDPLHAGGPASASTSSSMAHRGDKRTTIKAEDGCMGQAWAGEGPNNVKSPCSWVPAAKLVRKKGR